MRKKLISVRVNPKIHKTAKEMGLNISKACENGLKQQIQLLKTSKSTEESRMTPVRASLPSTLVGPPGFEPESREPKSQSLDHASRRPLSLREQRNQQILEPSNLMMNTDFL